jgi:TonB family protein
MRKMTEQLCAVMVAALLATGYCAAATVGSPPIEVLATPAPEYPEELLKSGKEGEVRAEFSVQSTGVVTDVTIIQTSDPLFTQAVREALQQWRFGPWTPSETRPAFQRATKKFLFRHEEDWFKKLLGKRCLDISQEYLAFRRENLDQPIGEMKSFKTMRGTLLLQRVTGAMSEQGVQQLADRYDKALPRIVQHCRNSPNATFDEVMHAEMPLRKIDLRQF